MFSNGVDSAGQSSFARLAARATSATALIDLGCGSGRLLQICEQLNPCAQKLGVDLSRAELQVASSHLPRVQFVQARAQALPLRADSVDCVLCHMALMLMDDPEHVLAEASRVLRRGGVFAAVTQRQTGDALPPPLGDVRTTDATAFRGLAASWFPEVRIDSFDLVQPIERTELPSFLSEALYGIDALPPQDIAEVFGELDLPDQVWWTTPMLHLSARA
ncbi:MAG: class I SAM-dependent methyltransferase [Acidobacteria bacterium]|nr:class I SAM-dependent methyltransferase [Acidobacteriota bacterium]